MILKVNLTNTKNRSILILAHFISIFTSEKSSIGASCIRVKRVSKLGRPFQTPATRSTLKLRIEDQNIHLQITPYLKMMILTKIS